MPIQCHRYLVTLVRRWTVLLSACGNTTATWAQKQVSEKSHQGQQVRLELQPLSQFLALWRTPQQHPKVGTASRGTR